MAAPRLDTALLPLAPSVRGALAAAGFRTAADFAGLTVADVARAANLSPADAAQALASLPPPLFALAAALPGAASAGALLRRERAATRIITFVADLDRVLGGGVAPGQLTEFCGAPAVGKTQLALQLALDAAIPAAFGGADGDTIYIDTEGGALPERATALATALAAHLARLAAREPADTAAGAAKRGAAAGAGAAALLGRVRVLRVRDASSLAAALAALPALCDRHPAVKLIVVDSIAFLARGAPGGAATKRSERALAATAASLAALARDRSLAVVLTNQMTTRVVPGEGAKLVPALGVGWAHAPTTQVVLAWRNGARVATLVKSPSLPTGRAAYVVTRDGVRGVGQRGSKREREKE